MRWRPLDASPVSTVTDWHLLVEPAQQRMPSVNRCVGDMAVAPGTRSSNISRSGASDAAVRSRPNRWSQRSWVAPVV